MNNHPLIIIFSIFQRKLIQIIVNKNWQDREHSLNQLFFPQDQKNDTSAFNRLKT